MKRLSMKWWLVLLVALLLALMFVPYLIQQVWAQGPECPPGFVWKRMSGVGCMQEGCLDNANAKYSYTGACICIEGYKGCYEPVDYTAFDGSKCGPFCPNSTLIACVEPDAPCPGEEPAPSLGEETVEPMGSPTEGEEPSSPEEPAPGPGEEAVTPVVPATEGEEPTSPPTVSDLVRDLEEFLAGKGVNGPTPGQAAATGAATATLLMTWLMNQLLSGANREDLLKAIQQWWRGGDTAPQQKPVEKIGEGDRVPRKVPPEAKEIIPVKKPPPHIPERVPVPETPPRIPVEEDLESKARRLGRDARDYLQAFDDTLNDAKKLKDKIGGKVPDELKTDTQKKVERTVDNVLDKVRKTTKLDEAKQFVDKANTYMKDWERVDQKLKDRPVSKEAKNAVKMLETATRAATEILMQVSDRAHDTLAEVVEKVLSPFSPETAGRAKKAIEEQKEALHKVREGVVHLPTSAVRTTTSKRFGEYWEAAEKNNPELRGIKGPGAFKPVKRDFETGSEKAARWYEEFRQWLDKHGPWQLRRVKPLDPD